MIFKNPDMTTPNPAGGAPPAISRTTAKHQTHFLGEVRAALHHVCRSVKALENGCLLPHEAGLAYQPVAFLHQLAENSDFSTMAAACAILQMQVMNLFQSRFETRALLTAAILQQAAVVELEASRAVMGRVTN